MIRFSLLFVTIIFATLSVSSQSISGSWGGILKVGSAEIPVVINIVKDGGKYSATFDSPSQGVKGIPATSTTFGNSELKIAIANIGIEYVGEFKDGKFIGVFRQGASTFNLILSRDTFALPKRPQEPKAPFPYYSEDVKFRNPDANITLAGTLTLPKKEGVFPTVVLISGSGQQNRDEEAFGHKPFFVLADHLTRNGIGVLRFDDRGVGESEGNFAKATSKDFATDVESAVRYLRTRKDIDKSQIGLIGHSEGGIIAPMVAANSKDIAFVVLLAGVGIPLDRNMLLQKELYERSQGGKEAVIQGAQKLFKGAYEIIKRSANEENIEPKLKSYFLANHVSESIASRLAGQLSSDWWRFFISYDPSIALRKVRIPVLALNGENDFQVPSKINLDGIECALRDGGNNKVTIKELHGLNHLFQECTTCKLDEYGTLEQTFSPLALSEILNWITKLLK